MVPDGLAPLRQRAQLALLLPPRGVELSRDAPVRKPRASCQDRCVAAASRVRWTVRADRW